MRAWYVESMAMACLEKMSDDVVLEGVEMLARRSNEITARLLAYPIEVEERGLHLREACWTLFAFCVERHRLVAESAPRPDVASQILALPQPVGPAETVAAALGVGLEVRAPERVARAVGTADAVAAVGVGLEVRAPERVRNAVVAPLSPRRYYIRVTIDEATHDKLRQLQDLLAHSVGRDPAVIVARAIDVLQERTLARKAAVTKTPRRGTPAKKSTRTSPRR